MGLRLWCVALFCHFCALNGKHVAGGWVPLLFLRPLPLSLQSQRVDDASLTTPL